MTRGTSRNQEEDRSLRVTREWKGGWVGHQVDLGSNYSFATDQLCDPEQVNLASLRV